MGMAKIVAVALLVAAPVFADSVVSYELLLGGDNSATAIKAGTRTMYAGGDPADSQVYPAGVLNWAATVAVAGNHSQSGHPSNGLPTQGVANFVFTVELHAGTAGGPLVTDADFYSSVHDGTGALDCTDCAGGGGICAGSAFAFGFNLPPSWGPARVFEAFEFSVFGGPHLDVCMYPTVEPGRILGTGAGYAQWCRGAACGLGAVTTKGLGVPTGSGGLGGGPVVEGQIDTSTLAPGTYVLVLNPGTGTNVLRGDVDLVTAPTAGNPQVQAFAVAANQAVGDTVTFTIGGPGPCEPLVTAAVSRKTHTGVGDFDTDVSTSSAIENRTGGPTKLVVTFDEPIQGVGGLDNSDVQVSSGSVTGVAINGSQLTVDLAGTTNASTLTVGFAGIQCSSNPGDPSASTLCFRSLIGDANSDAAVNIFDLIAIRNVLNQAVVVGNFTKDVNADGAINIFDLIGTRNVLNTTVGGCP